MFLSGRNGRVSLALPTVVLWDLQHGALSTIGLPAERSPMVSENPHYLLFSEASHDDQHGRSWRFVLQNVDTQRRFTAADAEPSDCGERLELLAVVRGLEALDRPARVTLVTKSRYVSRGLRCSLSEWRYNDWHWERFGRLVEVKDHDLWQRLDRAVRIHQVDCQAWQFDDPTGPISSIPTEQTTQRATAKRHTRPLLQPSEIAPANRRSAQPARATEQSVRRIKRPRPSRDGRNVLGTGPGRWSQLRAIVGAALGSFRPAPNSLA